MKSEKSQISHQKSFKSTFKQAHDSFIITTHPDLSFVSRREPSFREIQKKIDHTLSVHRLAIFPNLHSTIPDDQTT